MVVGFVHLYGYGLGDDFIALEALYALKKIYNCKVVLFRGGGAMRHLISQVDFIDEYCELNDYLSQDSLKLINKYTYDYLIITKFYRHIFSLLPQINARKIIIACKGANVFLPLLHRNIRTIPMRNLCLQKVGVREHLLKMVRAINPKLYDKRVKALDLREAIVQTTTQNKQFVDEFLATKLKSKNTALILVNPFNITSAYSLSLDGFFELMRQICKLQNPHKIIQGGGAITKSNAIVPLVITYPKVHNEFISELNRCEDIKNSVLVFENNDDLLNLVEMISRCAVVIAPSTGVIHIASNMGIKTIGLYEKSESTKWRTKDNNYVFLKQPKSSLSKQEESIAIEKTIELLKQILNSTKL